MKTYGLHLDHFPPIKGALFEIAEGLTATMTRSAAISVQRLVATCLGPVFTLALPGLSATPDLIGVADGLSPSPKKSVAGSSFTISSFAMAVIHAPSVGANNKVPRRIPMKLVTLLNNLRRDESGQDLIEYALVAALIALGATAAMSTLATSIGTAFGTVGTKLTTAM